jgi:hypothetical protein
VLIDMFAAETARRAESGLDPRSEGRAEGGRGSGYRPRDAEPLDLDREYEHMDLLVRIIRSRGKRYIRRFRTAEQDIVRMLQSDGPSEDEDHVITFASEQINGLARTARELDRISRELDILQTRFHTNIQRNMATMAELQELLPHLSMHSLASSARRASRGDWML